jgi:thiol-disulfide isomerase/thioredoxin
MFLRLLTGWVSLLVCLVAQAAAPITLDTLTVGARTYTNVTIIGANETDLYFKHSRGFANVRLRYLDPELQQQFEYDAKVAAEAERRQQEDDALYQAMMVSNMVAQAEKTARAAKKRTLTSEDSLADPVSDKSLVGKPIPPLVVEKWMGNKPDLKAKPALIVFWAPWSIPCRKYIAELNALHRQSGEKLTLVAVTSDPEEEVAELGGAQPAFFSAIDTKARLAGAVGAAQVPYVVLVDSNSIVRYVGHPAAVSDKRLTALLVPPAD